MLTVINENMTETTFLLKGELTQTKYYTVAKVVKCKGCGWFIALFECDYLIHLYSITDFKEIHIQIKKFKRST